MHDPAPSPPAGGSAGRVPAPALPLRVLGALALGAALTAPLAAAAQQADYLPPRGSWERVSPEAVGMRADLLEEARSIHLANEPTTPRDLALAHQRSFAREPFGEQVGPFKERGEATAVVVRNGYIVAEWGEPDRVDVTFSVTKSFLSSTVGLAWDRGLIPDLHEPVARLMAPVEVEMPECVAPRPSQGAFPQVPSPFEPFTGEHNSRITWDDLLRQTSDWEGMLWCKPDWGDRPAQNPDTWGTRERHEPGTVYEYNDVRVNLLALASLNVWRTPLPVVLREHLMDPIGASPTWRWTGYETSWIRLDGAPVQSVSGGAHWGGGMFISALDLARFGLLHLRDGRWGDRQLLSEAWLDQARSPGPANDRYGFMNYFLNTDRRGIASAPESVHYHVGAGSNIVYVDPEHDLVVVVRWIRQGALSEFIGKILEAVAQE
jgi:CubicO group peptidase (beta-lactamase class C family)